MEPVEAFAVCGNGAQRPTPDFQAEAKSFFRMGPFASLACSRILHATIPGTFFLNSDHTAAG